MKKWIINRECRWVDVRKMSIAIIGLMLLINKSGYGQDKIPKVTPPSPNAASIGIYGQIPVTIFNGLPQISIPIGKVTTGDLDMDINIGYHGGGIRPDQHSSWVGLGWNLTAGGIITRKINGGVDEVYDSTEPDPNKYSYYYNFGYLDNDSWFSEASLRAVSNNRGSKAIPSPDEFSFNFGSYSGSFYLNHKGKWQVKSEQPLDLKVEEELQSNYILATTFAQQADPITLRRIFYKFTLTTPDGNKYIFGGTPESIEFTRGATDHNVDYSEVIPSSWNLTQVITAKGRQINFKYARGGVLGTLSNNYSQFSYQIGSVYKKGGSHTPSMSVVNPVYLTQIEADNQKVVFERSQSNEMLYDYNKIGNGQMNSLATYDDLSKRGRFEDIRIELNKNWQKLDRILFYNGSSELLKKISFSYHEKADSRLILNSLQESGSDGTLKPPHNFFYNDQVALPKYNSEQLDHWGFYNGKSFFEGKPVNSIYTKNDVPEYTKSKESNFSFMSAGNLTSIQFPTGGSTIFEYQPHEYSLIVNHYPFDVISVTNTPAGGLRIWKISDIDAFGKTVNLKEYKYVTNYNLGQTVSSGILAGTPVYLEEATARITESGLLNYWYWYDFSIEPMSYTSGNHVTYTEVAEKLADGSYTIYNYANHNQAQYRDQGVIIGVYTATGQGKLDPLISLDLDRGKLLEKRVYNARNKILKGNQYAYDELNETRKYEQIRIIEPKERYFELGPGVSDIRISAYIAYTFPRLKTIDTEKNFDPNGENPVSTVRTFMYNNAARVLKKETYTNSKLEVSSSFYKYPGDLLNNDANGIYNNMHNNRHMRAMVIEKIDTLNSNQINYSKTNYFNPAGSLFVPQSVDEQIGSAPLETRVIYDNYDSKGNIRSMYPYKGSKTTYLWAYNGQYPIAEIKNASYSAVENILGANSINNFTNSTPDKTTVDNFLAPLKNQLPDARVTSFVYLPMIGVTAQTDPKGQSFYYEYDSFQRLKSIRDQDKNVIKSFRYNYISKVNVFYNVTKSKPFIKNNCPAGFIGSTEVYTVSSGKYKAATQAEADALAQADIDANGQAEVNKAGTCTQVPVCVGVDKKMINGVCETGQKVYTSSVPKPNDTYSCIYRYVFSDKSTSEAFYEEGKTEPCFVPGG